MNKFQRFLPNYKLLFAGLLLVGTAWSSFGTTASAQSEPPLIKAQISGLVDRNKAPATAYQVVVNGYVVSVDWADLQTSRGATITANNAIDQAITYVRKINTANAGLDMKLKLRVYAGAGAPAWAKNIGGAPFNVCDDNNQKNGSTAAAPNCGSVGRFWTTDFGLAYADLQSKLAAKYDNVPEIRETAISRCSTIFAEPFQRQVDDAVSVKAMVNAGLTPVLDQACLKAQIDAHKVWVHTRSSLAVNPFQSLTSAGTASPSIDYSKTIIDYCRQVLGERCVLGNNGFDKPPHNKSIVQIYDYIKGKGKPIYFQTKTFAKNSDLLPTFQSAVGFGAAMVEMPKGYDTAYTPAQLSAMDKQLEANASPAVHSPAAVVPTPEAKTETKTEAPPGPAKSVAPPAKKHHSHRFLWLGIGVFALLVAVAVGGAIAFRLKKGHWPPLNPKHWRRKHKPPTSPDDPPSIYPTPTRPSY